MKSWAIYLFVLWTLLCGHSLAQDDKSAISGAFSPEITEELITKNPTIPRISVTYDVHYKLSTLMGEPLRNFGMKWRFSGFWLRSGKNEGDEIFMGTADARERFGPAIDKLELALSGLASAHTRSPDSPLYGHPLVMEFETGVSTRQNKMSWNVPGSPNWNKLFLESPSSCDGPRASLSGYNTGSRRYVDVATAKSAFKVGQFTLDSTVICRRGTTMGNLDGLVSAIAKHCVKTKSAEPWCPATKAGTNKTSTSDDKAATFNPLDDGKANQKASIADLLDETAEKPQLERKLAAARARYQLESQQVCQQTMQSIEACFVKSGCEARLPAGVTFEQCDSIGSKPRYGKLRLSSGGNCDAACERRVREEDDREYQSAMGRWNAKYGELGQRCKPYRESRSQIQSCRANNQTSCNPNKFTKPEDCVAYRLKNNAPTEQDARALLRQEQERKKREPTEQKPHNFLD